MKKNNYWSDFKNQNKNKWHFNALKKKTKDYLYIGNIKYNYKNLSKKISLLEKKPKYLL